VIHHHAVANANAHVAIKKIALNAHVAKGHRACSFIFSMYSIEPMELSILVALTLPLLVAALPWVVMCYTDRLADQTFEELARLNAKII